MEEASQLLRSVINLGVFPEEPDRSEVAQMLWQDQVVTKEPKGYRLGPAYRKLHDTSNIASRPLYVAVTWKMLKQAGDYDTARKVIKLLSVYHIPRVSFLNLLKTEDGWEIQTRQRTIFSADLRGSKFVTPDVGRTMGRNETGHKLPTSYTRRQRSS